MNTDAALEALRAKSADCPHCHGAGMVTIYDRRYRGQATETLRYRDHRGEQVIEQVVLRATTYCLCPLGTRMRAGTTAETSARMPDLAAVLEGRTRWTDIEPEGS